MLFTVNTSPFRTRSLETCLRLAPPGTPILLYEDAVYAARPGTCFAGQVREAAGRRPLYALDADLRARGIDGLVEGVQVVDYAGFVALVEEHAVVPWL